MQAVITGDLKDSQEISPEKWLPSLKEVLNQFGREPIDWNIYRGDSFQLVMSPEEAMRAALMIKASMRTYGGLDVRMGIGLGEEEFKGDKVSESNGDVYIKSGKSFEELKKVTMSVKSGDEDKDKLFNYMLELALLRMNEWPPATASVVYTQLKYPDLIQSQLAKKLKKSQSSVSEALSRAGFDEIIRLKDFFAFFYL